MHNPNLNQYKIGIQLNPGRTQNFPTQGVIDKVFDTAFENTRRVLNLTISPVDVTGEPNVRHNYITILFDLHTERDTELAKFDKQAEFMTKLSENMATILTQEDVEWIDIFPEIRISIDGTSNTTPAKKVA